MTESKYAALRREFIELLTQESETRDMRRREYNQALFDPESGNPVWSSTDLGMVLEKFDKAVKNQNRKSN
jgi:hypothetical protein